MPKRKRTPSTLLQVRVPVAMKEAIASLAADHFESEADTVRAALRIYLDSNLDQRRVGGAK